MASIRRDEITKSIDEMIEALRDPQDVISLTNVLIVLLQKLRSVVGNG